MSSGWAAAAQAAMQLVDTGLDVGMGLWSANQAKKEASKNRQFQYDMYTQRYQYTMADMKKAGLNPMLAYQQGGGAGLPGSQANIPAIKPSSGAKDAIRSALDIKETEARIENIKENTIKTRQEGYRTDMESVNLRNRNSILEEDLHSAKAAAAAAKTTEEILSTPIGKAARGVGTILREVNPFLDAGHSGAAKSRSQAAPKVAPQPKGKSK